MRAKSGTCSLLHLRQVWEVFSFIQEMNFHQPLFFMLLWWEEHKENLKLFPTCMQYSKPYCNISGYLKVTAFARFLPVSVAFYLNRTVVKKSSLFCKRMDHTWAISSWTKRYCYIEIQYFHLSYTPNSVRRRILSKIWTMNERPFRFCSWNIRKSSNPKSKRNSSFFLKLEEQQFRCITQEDRKSCLRND